MFSTIARLVFLPFGILVDIQALMGEWEIQPQESHEILARSVCHEESKGEDKTKDGRKHPY